MRFKVEKMSCNHCVRAITGAIQALDPQARVEADLASGTVEITGTVQPDAAIAAMLEEGYPARRLEP